MDERAGCSTLVKAVAAEGCGCWMLQQEGRLWFKGAGLGQWLQASCWVLGCSMCNACRQEVALSKSINKHIKAAKLWRVFFIPAPLDASKGEVGALG